MCLRFHMSGSSFNEIRNRPDLIWCHDGFSPLHLFRRFDIGFISPPKIIFTCQIQWHLTLLNFGPILLLFFHERRVLLQITYIFFDSRLDILN